MPRRLHRKRKNIKLRLGLSILLIVILALSGIYIEHARKQQAAAEKNTDTELVSLPETSNGFKNKQPIEPKNAVSANIEQALVEKNFSGTVLVFQQGKVILNKAYGWKDQAKKFIIQLPHNIVLGLFKKDKLLI